LNYASGVDDRLLNSDAEPLEDFSSGEMKPGPVRDTVGGEDGTCQTYPG
jgi:hypothetical protein